MVPRASSTGVLIGEDRSSTQRATYSVTFPDAGNFKCCLISRGHVPESSIVLTRLTRFLLTDLCRQAQSEQVRWLDE